MREESVLNLLFHLRGDELGEDIEEDSNEKTERFLDVVQNVKEEDLKNRLTKIYLKLDDNAGSECARLTKRYYCSRFFRWSKTRNRVCSAGRKSYEGTG